MENRFFHGRRKIYTSANTINEANIIQELNLALGRHLMNVSEMNYLYWYARGNQPVLQRVKEIRPEICNKVVVNNAAMIIDFKNGYFLNKPINYISRREDKDVESKVKELNEYLYTSGKHEADNEVVDNFHTMGLGVLYVEPNKDETEKEYKPVCVYSLDPTSAFVVYSMNPGNKPVFAVNMVIGEDKSIYLDVFTNTQVFRLYGGAVYGVADKILTAVNVQELLGVEQNVVGIIPIIEYQYNSKRTSAFEPAIPIMDAINEAESARLDGIDQFIQSLVVLYNCELEEGQTANTIRENGLISLKGSSGDGNKADIKILSDELDQNGTQTVIDDLYNQMCEKVGVPSSIKDKGSTSDNVGAVYLRDGWAMAETCALNAEDEFKKANRYFDKVFLKILEKTKGFKLSPVDFECCFLRNTQSNILVKTQSAMNMKQLGLHPQIALERSGLSSDPIKDIEVSKDFIFKAWEVTNSQNNNNDKGKPNVV